MDPTYAYTQKESVMIDLLVRWAHNKVYPCTFGDALFLDLHWKGTAWNVRMHPGLVKLYIYASLDLRYGN